MSIDYKKKLIKKLVMDTAVKAEQHKKRSVKYKTIDDIFETSIIGFSTMTMSSIIINQTGNVGIGYLNAALSSVSMVLSALKRAMSISEKWSNSRRIHSDLMNLNREIVITLGRNHLNSDQLDTILTDYHQRLSLIYGSSPLLEDTSEGVQIGSIYNMSDRKTLEHKNLTDSFSEEKVEIMKNNNIV